MCSDILFMDVTFKLKEKDYVICFWNFPASHPSARIPYSRWLANKEQAFNYRLIDGSESQPVSSGKVGLSSEFNKTESLKAMIKILAFILRLTRSDAEF